MSKFDKRKIAATLAFASLFSGKSQAMGTKSLQTLGAVGADSKINSTTNKKGLSVGEKVLVTLGATVIAAEAYNEVIALARGDKPKTLFTGKYSFTELVRNRNKKKKPGEPSQDENKESQKVFKPEPLKPAPKKGFNKGQYFSENTKKFTDQFSGKPEAVKGFQEFQRQVLELGVDGILESNVIKDSDSTDANDVSKEDETLRQTLESACKVISGQVPMNMSQIHDGSPRYVRVESKAGNFCVYASINNCGFELHNKSGDDNKVFSFRNITGN